MRRLAHTDQIMQLVNAGLQQSAQLAAGRNIVVSREEQAASPSGLIRDGAETVRREKGPGAKVVAKEAADAAFRVVEGHLGEVNQATGPGARLISSDEIRRVHARHAESGERLAKAYEVLTGKTMRLERAPVSDRPALLPSAARSEFAAMMRDYGLVEGSVRVRIGDTTGDEASGYSFGYRAGEQSGTAFAKYIDGGWFFGPSPITVDQYAAVKTAALAFFDGEMAANMREYEASDAEIAAARAATKPTRAFFPGESDPHNYVADFPLVFQIKNETGSDHGIYCGYDPRSGATEVYAFN